MNQKNFSLTVIFFILGLTKSYAGWYKCYNYEGTIGKHPIALSFQITEGYFGEKEKKEFNINGVYKYDKYNNPIKLEGILKNNKIRLYESHNGKVSAILEFDFSKKTSIGFWTDLESKKVLSLNLNYDSKLIDTNERYIFKSIDILQLYSLKDFYFIGNYSKNKGELRAKMEKLKIINKKDNSIFQVIDFNDLDYNVGNVITIIYQNIEINDVIDNKLDVWCDIGRMGGWFTINFDKQKNKFITNYELNIDGAN